MSRRPLSHAAGTAQGGAGHTLRTQQRQAAAWWAARSPRERTLLQVGALVVCSALIWLAGMKPALDSIAHARENLPRLRAEAVQVDALIREAQALERRQTGRIAPADLVQALHDDLRRAGLAAHAASGATPADTPETHAGWHVELADAPAAAVMNWLAGLPYRLQLRVDTIDLTRSRINGRDRPGHVSGRIMLQPPQKATP